jgi:predicted restriction endonuclease
MQELENFLDNYKLKKLNYKDINYKLFNYENKKIFKHHLFFLLDNFYDIKLIDDKKKRLKQEEFRKKLLNKYNNKCIISGNSCLLQLEAAHIIPIRDNENYDINNGIILTRNLHKTFDEYYWSINPETLKVEINNNIKDLDVGDILQYKHQKIDIDTNSDLLNNLKHHYDIFVKKID